MSELALLPGPVGQCSYMVPLIWNDAVLQAIRVVQPPVTVVARALAIVHTCMYDAWSAYNRNACSTILDIRLRRPPFEHTRTNKEIALSYAAFRSLLDLFPQQAHMFVAIMLRLGYDPDEQRIDTVTPVGIGNLVAHIILSERHHDGSNQCGDLHPGAYSDYTNYQPVHSLNQDDAPDCWQPQKIMLSDYRWTMQQFTTPHWSKVTPFALHHGDQFRPFLRPAQPGSRQYWQQANDLLDLSANLTDQQKAIVEYWQSGPHGEQSPSHWCLIAQYVVRRDMYNLDRAVKLFFILSNALFDASIACWDTKRAYNAPNPMTVIRHLYQNRKVQTWGGPYRGTQLIAGETWCPYQPVLLAELSSPEYCSEHSCFSAAAATILTLFTGSSYFGGAAIRPAGSSQIEPGRVPTTDIPLYWRTFTEAANEAGISRRYGGFHFEQSDLVGRALGRAIASIVWYQAQKYIHGFDATYDQPDTYRAQSNDTHMQISRLHRSNRPTWRA